jgi:hypothetical protein
MDDQAAEILDICLVQLAGGTSIDECLAAYPLQRAELEAPLRAAVRLMQLPHPTMPAATRATLESQMLARSAARRQAAYTPPWWRMAPSVLLAGVLRRLGLSDQLSTPALRIATLAVALVLALMLSVGTYAAVRTIRNIFIAPPQPTAQPTPTATAVPLTFSLEGQIEQIAQEGWVVAGTTIVIDDQTVITGTAAVSATVRVDGVIRPDSVWLARRVEVGAQADPIASPVPPTAPAVPNTATIVPTPIVFPTITPTAALPPAPVVAPGGTDNSRSTDQNDPNKQCQGQQIGRDEKKCDPKPKPAPKPKDDGKKGNDKKDDKKGGEKKGK